MPKLKPVQQHPPQANRKSGKITQERYLEILFNDCGFTVSQRKAWLKDKYGKQYADELTVKQKSDAIDYLKEIKEDKKPKSQKQRSLYEDWETLDELSAREDKECFPQGGGEDIPF